MEDELKWFFAGFIVILIGIIFTQMVADNVYSVTHFTKKMDTVTSWATSTNVTLAKPYVSFTGIVNATGSSVPTTNYTLYADNHNYVYIYGNSSVCASTQTCYILYDYRQDNYVNDSVSQNLLNLLAMFMAIGVVSISLWMVGKKNDWF